MHHTPYHSIHHHFRKHAKHYIRFIAFFFFLMAFSIIEDLIAVTTIGVKFDFQLLSHIVILALIFTAIAHRTEKLFEKEAEKVEEFVEIEEPKIKKALKRERKFLRRIEKRI